MNYIVTVQHDKGQTRIKVFASSADAAVKMVMEAEGCPRRAIKYVEAAQTIPTAVVTIRGGTAEIAHLPGSMRVIIVDHDNLQEDEQDQDMDYSGVIAIYEKKEKIDRKSDTYKILKKEGINL